MTAYQFCYFALFLVEALTAWLYLEYLFERKSTAGCRLGAFLLAYTSLYLISLFNNTTVNALSFFLANFFLIFLNYKCTRKNAFLHSAFLCFIMVISEILVALFISIFGYEFDAYTYHMGVMIALIILSKFLYLVFAAVGSRFFTPHKHKCEEPHLMLLFCLLPLVSAAIAVFIVYIGMTSGITEITAIMTLMTVLTLLVVNLVALVLYNYLQKANEDYLTLQLSIQKDMADTAYYQALQAQYENQRILIHDIKKHLVAIDVMAKQHSATEIETYISELNAYLTPSNHIKFCSDPILNFLLLRFQDDCKENNVVFDCDVREDSSSFMDSSSVTTLFGNLLTNALDSAKVSDEKQIELSVTRNEPQSVVVISVINSCNIAPTPDGHGKFLTNKENKSNHGIGLKSMDRVIKRYKGLWTMYYSEDTRQFHSIIQFPLPS